jgi:hypothetical protein
MAQGKSNRSGGVIRSLPRRPTWDADDISSMLRSYDRTPFMDVLAAFLECGPEPEDIIAFAAKKPDLWAKAVADLARLSGYTEKQEVLHTVNVNQMSDSQLEDKAAEMARALGLEVAPRLLTHTKPSPIPSQNSAARELYGSRSDDEVLTVNYEELAPNARPVRRRRKPTKSSS